MNFKEMFEELIFNDFVNNIDVELSKLKEKNNVNNEEELLLLKQSLISIKDAKELIINYSFVSGIALLRVAFENIAMSYSIRDNLEAYEEFKSGKKDEINATKTVKKFGRTLQNNIPESLAKLSNTKTDRMIDEYYDYLSNYIHSTNCVIKVAKLESQLELDLYRWIVINNVITLLTLLYGYLLYINNSELGTFNEINVISYFIIFKLTINDYKNLKGFDFNKFIYNSKKKVNYIDSLNKEEIEQLNEGVNILLNEDNYSNTLKQNILKYYKKVSSNSKKE